MEEENKKQAEKMEKGEKLDDKEKVDRNKQENKEENKNNKSELDSEKKVEENDKSLEQKIETKTDDKKTESAEKVKTKKSEKTKVKKTEASVKAVNFPISTKHAIAICKFIKGKTIEIAILDLQQVSKGKKAVPMKGEIPHRKGKGIMSGRFPKKASEHFVKLLQSLGGNAVANNLDEPIIVEAIANIGERPYGRFGRTRKKRTHVFIKVKEKTELNKMKKER